MARLSILLWFATVLTQPLLAQKNNSLDPRLFQQQMSNAANAQVLDVRTSGEYQSGHLKNALLADWTQKQQFIDRVRFVDKSKPVYIYCLSGGRSAAAAQWMRQNGYDSVYELKGGIKAWEGENLPVEATVAVKQLSMEEFKTAVGQTGRVLVDFGAEWCPPCIKMRPVLADLQKKEGNNLRIIKIDGGAQTEIMKQLHVEAMPTFIIYQDGLEKWRKQGVVESDELSAALHQ